MKSFKDIFQYSNGQAFPNTKAITASGSDSYDGTEYNELVVNEILGFFQAALFQAGLVPNGTSDTAQASQILGSILSLSKTVRQGRFNVWPTVSAKDGYVDCMVEEHICPSVASIPEIRKYTTISFQRWGTYNSCYAPISKVGSTNPYSTFKCYLEWDNSSGVSPLIGTNGQAFAYIPCIALYSQNVAVYSGYISFDHTTVVPLNGVPTRCITVTVNLFTPVDVSVAPNLVVLKNCDLSFNSAS